MISDKQQSYRVLIIEPSLIIQQGLSSMIEENKNLSVVASYPDINRLEERLVATRPDIIIVNPNTLDYHRRSLIKSIITDKPVVALVYNYIDDDILKQYNSIIGINDTQAEIHSKLLDALKEDNTNNTASDLGELSDREIEILIAVAKGLLNKEIAQQHNISIHTVISHRKNISRKTGIKSASGFAVYALLNNLLDQSEIQ